MPSGGNRWKRAAEDTDAQHIVVLVQAHSQASRRATRLRTTPGGVWSCVRPTFIRLLLPHYTAVAGYDPKAQLTRPGLD